MNGDGDNLKCPSSLQTATINEEDAKKINDSMNIPLSIITFLEFILMILGVLIILLSLFCYMVFPGHKVIARISTCFTSKKRIGYQL